MENDSRPITPREVLSQHPFPELPEGGIRPREQARELLLHDVPEQVEHDTSGIGKISGEDQPRIQSPRLPLVSGDDEYPTYLPISWDDEYPL